MKSETRNKLTASIMTRGESAVAALGLVGALLMAGAIGAGGWWTLHTNQAAKIAGREKELRAVADLLGQSAQHMLDTGDTSGLRGMIVSAGARHELQSITLTLGGIAGGEPLLIADADPKPGTRYAALPETWPASGSAIEPVTVSRAGDMLQIDVPVVVGKKGVATLSMRDARRVGLLSDWEVVAGIGAIGAFGMGAVLVGYRAARKRFRALGAIRDALAALKDGEKETGSLGIAPAFGPEAQEWNKLLDELGTLRAKMAQDKAAGSGGGNRRRGEGDLTSLCDAMWQGLVLIDDKLNVRYVNGAAAVFLRGKREEMQGKDLAGFVSDPKAIEAIRGVASGASRSRTVVEVELGGEEQKTVLRFTVRPVRKEDSATAILVIEDVTQQRLADASRQAFVASATHELRTPLTNVRLYVDTLLEDPDQDVTKRTEAMNVVSTEVRRLERMVGDMLSVAQIEAGQLKLNPGEVRLEPIFDELKSDFAEQARKKDIALKYELPPKWPLLSGDRDKIVMALHNLVGNAIKYTPAGGQVLVRVNADGPMLLVDVADNGIGIKEEEIPLVFEKFYRAKDKRIAGVTGTGLGLAIAREVVRLHGGDISLTSTVDKGSTFTMSLPAKAA